MKPVVIQCKDVFLVDLHSVDPYARLLLPQICQPYLGRWAVLAPEDALDLNLIPSNLFGNDEELFDGDA